MKSQVKLGIVLSYILIILNALYGLFLTPFIIRQIGAEDYGVYRTITALTSSLMVMDLGIGNTVLRYIAKYRAEKEENRISNFAAMSLIQSLLLCAIILLTCCVFFFLIRPMYSNTMDERQIDMARGIFVLLSINLICHVMENVLNGIIKGYNNFVFGNGIKLLRLVIRIALIVALLTFLKSPFTIVIIDLAITVACLFAEYIFIRFKLHLIIKLSKWEKAIFVESGIYTVLMFLTSIAAQVDGNLDNVVIGALLGPQLVTVYSIGLLIFSMYKNISVAVSGVMLPTVSNLLNEENGEEKVFNLVVKAGRFQFILLGAVVVGFAVIGKEFINLWMGSEYSDVYIITLILLIPALWELSVNVCLSILRAKNKIAFRTMVIFIGTLINAVITFVRVKNWSYIGAAIGTSVSCILGSLITMNIYYIKVMKIPIFSIYKRIIHRTWLCLIISALGLFGVSRLIYGSWLAFVIQFIVFCIIYAATLLLFGLNKEEKKRLPIIGGFFSKISR